MSISKEAWDQWASNPVTKLVQAHLQERCESLTSQMLNLDVTSPDFSLETYGLNSMALRYHIEGIAEFVDFETFELDMVREDGDEL